MALAVRSQDADTAAAAQAAPAGAAGTTEAPAASSSQHARGVSAASASTTHSNGSGGSSSRSTAGGGGGVGSSASSATAGSSSVATTLSERIAALQRANSGTPTSSPRRPTFGNGALDTSRFASSDHASGASPHASTSYRSTSAGAVPGASASAGGAAGPRGVRDRIARFQASGGSEAPLIPRSSFGAPAPNPDAVRGRGKGSFPAALVQGTGNWGETLRPQLTGGTWLQIGGTGGAGEAGMRPQYTGGQWGSPRVPTGRGGELTVQRVCRHTSAERAHLTSHRLHHRLGFPWSAADAHVRAFWRSQRAAIKG